MKREVKMKFEIGDNVVWNKNQTAATVGVITEIRGTDAVICHIRTNTYHLVNLSGCENE